MQSKIISTDQEQEPANHCKIVSTQQQLQQRKDQALLRVSSDTSMMMNSTAKMMMKMMEEEEEEKKASSGEALSISISNSNSNSEVESVECECCGMSEECTPTYIRRVKEYFEGRWICGLCSEAVKEKMKKRALNKEEALEAHMSLCKKFNRTVRLNPKLSLALSMRDIARKNSERRGGGLFLKGAGAVDLSSGTKILRAMSCGPSLDVNIQ